MTRRRALTTQEQLTETERAARVLRRRIATDQANAAAATGSPPGPAAEARPYYLDRIEGQSRGSVATARIDVLHYADATLYDRMRACGQLSDRQHEAAERLGRMWTAAGLNPRVSANLGTTGDGEDDDAAPIERPDDSEETAKDRYRRFMRGLTAAQCMILEAMLMDEHPGVARLASLQAALGDIADRWGMGEK